MDREGFQEKFVIADGGIAAGQSEMGVLQGMEKYGAVRDEYRRTLDLPENLSCKIYRIRDLVAPAIRAAYSHRTDSLKTSNQFSRKSYTNHWRLLQYRLVMKSS